MRCSVVRMYAVQADDCYWTATLEVLLLVISAMCVGVIVVGEVGGEVKTILDVILK